MTRCNSIFLYLIEQNWNCLILVWFVTPCVADFLLIYILQLVNLCVLESHGQNENAKQKIKMNHVFFYIAHLPQTHFSLL